MRSLERTVPRHVVRPVRDTRPSRAPVRRGAIAAIMAAILAVAAWVIGNGQASPSVDRLSSPPEHQVERGPEGFDPEFERRIGEAHQAASAAGLSWTINSGWRSAESQQALLDDAIVTYGSREAAYEWVLPPELSSHVQGNAVDIGPPQTAAWLDANGWRYGLCRPYDNEAWHFEPLAEPGQPCPQRESDASVLTR